MIHLATNPVPSPAPLPNPSLLETLLKSLSTEWKVAIATLFLWALVALVGRGYRRANHFYWDWRVVAERRDAQQQKRDLKTRRVIRTDDDSERKTEQQKSFLPASQPIHAPADLDGEDYFAVRTLAQNLAISFADSSSANPESEVWSLLGPWGSGKSTIAEYVIALLEDYHSDEVRVVRFEPWLLQDNHDLYSEFLTLIVRTRRSRKATKIIRRLKRSTQETPEIPVIGAALKTFMSSRFISNEEAFRRLRSTFAANRRFIFFNTKKQPRRTLVVVDDIDRLGKDEMLTVMKLVKVVGNLNGVDYLLCYDEEIVHRVLAQTHLETEDRAKQYMKKIVQHEVFLPETKNSKDGFHNYLHSNKNFRLLGLRGDEIVKKYAEKLLITPRDLSLYASGFDEAVITLGEEPKSKVNLHELAMIELIRVVDRDLYRYILNHRMGLASWDVCVQKDERMDLIQQIPTNPSPELQTRCNALGGLLRQLYPEPGTVPRTRSILRPDYVNRYFGITNWDDEFDLGKPDAVYHDQSPTDGKKSREIPDRISNLVKANIAQAVTQLDVMTAAVSGATATGTDADAESITWTATDRIAYFRLWSDTYALASETENAPMVTLARRATEHKLLDLPDERSHDRWETVLAEAPQRWQLCLEIAAAAAELRYGHTYGRVDPTTPQRPETPEPFELAKKDAQISGPPDEENADRLVELAIIATVDWLRQVHRPNAHVPRTHLPMPSHFPTNGSLFADGLWLLTPLSLVAPNRTCRLLRELHDHKHPGQKDLEMDIRERPILECNEWNSAFKQTINAANLRVDTYLEYKPTVRLHSDSVFKTLFRSSGYFDLQTVGTDAAARKRIADLMEKGDTAPYSIRFGKWNGSIEEGTLHSTQAPRFVSIKIENETLNVWDPKHRPQREDFRNVVGTEAAINEFRRGQSVRKLVLEECARQLELDLPRQAQEAKDRAKNTSTDANQTPAVIDDTDSSRDPAKSPELAI
jgi:ABC-type cobalamin/Fe3+-siderophores transport system ATPase subunit